MLLFLKKAKKSQMQFIAESVSYRIARPVTRVVRMQYGSCYPVCPRCFCSMDREYTAYCDRCGQHLSWGVVRWTDVYDSNEYQETSE